MATIAIDSNPFEPLGLKPQQLPNLALIQTSPYTGEEHLLDLADVPEELHTLVLALRDDFKAVRPDYAVGKYQESFPFEHLTKLLPADVTLHCVAFRSRLFDHVNMSSQMRQQLSDLDEASHSEANKSGGLLKYWFGIPDAQGNNLATCVWLTKGHADRATVHKKHTAAAKTVRGWYENWQVELYEWSRDGLKVVQ